MPRRTILLSAALGATLVAPAGADAANACRAKADKHRVLAQSTTALVYRTGRQFNRVVRACRFKAPRRSYRLPDQDGGNANRLSHFRLNGRYLGWVMINVEEASPTNTSFVYSADLKRRRKLVERFSGGSGSAERTTTEVTGLVVGAKGGIAWINDSINLDERLSVRTVAPRAPVTIVDRGNAIRRRSLALGADNRTFYWTKGAEARSAALAQPPSGG